MSAAACCVDHARLFWFYFLELILPTSFFGRSLDTGGHFIANLRMFVALFTMLTSTLLFAVDLFSDDFDFNSNIMDKAHVFSLAIAAMDYFGLR